MAQNASIIQLILKGRLDNLRMAIAALEFAQKIIRLGI